MIEVSANFKALGASAERQIGFQVTTNDNITFAENDIIEASIEQTLCEGGLQIGNASAARCTLVIRTTEKLKSGVRIIPYVRFYGDTASEWVPLGRFYVTKSYIERGYLYVTAHDKLYFTDKSVTWNGRASSGLEPLTFPATMQQMLDYICQLQGLECDFTCEEFTVQEKPTDYTRRQIIGYIAASHGGNAYITNTGKLGVKLFEDTGVEISLDNCFSQVIDNSEAYTVNGIMFSVGDDSIYIDGSDAEYDDEAAGIVHSENPFASVEIAEYVWHKIGGLTYHDCKLEKQGFGWLECGDLVTVKDVSEPNAVVKNIVITGLQYNISSSDGFTETLFSEAETASQSSNRNNKSGSGSSSGLATKTLRLPINWAGSTAPFTQAIEVKGIKSNSACVYDVAETVTKAELVAFENAKLVVTSQSDGELVFSAFGTKPTIEIPISIIIWG